MTEHRHQATEAVLRQAITEVRQAVRPSAEAAEAAVAVADTAEAEVQADTEDKIHI